MPPPPWVRGGRPPGPYADDPNVEAGATERVPQVATLERPRECVNKHSTPPFSLLCTMMDRLRSEEANKRRDTLARFMNLWRVKVGNDLYPLIRLILPDRDRERPVYNLKEAMLAKCYIEVLGLDRHSEAANRLIKWKQPVDGQSDSHSGDFARVCYHEIAARSTVEEGQLTIDAVNALLDQLAGGRLKQAEYVPILRKINQQCTPVEQEWIIRIILKDLRISIREKGVLAIFHPDAADLFNVCSDLKRVCWTLYKPDIRLEKHQTNIELFRSFLPQLCYRSPSSSHDGIAKLVGAPHAEFIMEEKLDGERMQLHMRGNGAEWYYCSRKAKDYTYLYGAHPGEGSLTQHIASAFGDDVRNIILDGEMLVWDPVLEKYLAFGTLKTAALERDGDANAPRPCFKIFDILLLNDKCLTSKRLSERKRLLRSTRIFPDIAAHKGRLEFAEEGRGKNGKDIRAMLEKILESRGEGLVVKRLDAMYQTNSRGADWIKVKPEYSDQMGENLDLLVLGGWWGKGGRTGKISSLLCGLRVPQDDDGMTDNPEFTTFLKIGSGMSYEDYEWILNKHKNHWKTFDRKHPPRWMKLGEVGTDDKPDVYIEPKHSFVVEAKGSEIVPAAGNYGIGYTMRFPRCRFIYWDKASRDHPVGDDSQDRDMWNCLSAEEFTALLNRPTRKYEDDETGSRARKKRKITTTRKKVEFMSNVQGKKRGEDEVQSAIFGGLTFYIPKGSAQHKKADLEALVHKHGGEYSQAQLSDLSAVVIAPDEKSPLVRAQIRKDVSVVRPEWLFASIERERALPLIKEFLIHASAVAQDDRYYNKTLEQIDGLSLVRDRGGGRGGNGSDEEGEEEEDGEEEGEDKEGEDLAYDYGVSKSKKRKARRALSDDPDDDNDNDNDNGGNDVDAGTKDRCKDSDDRHEPAKTDKQKQMEDDWGLHRSRSPSDSQSTRPDDDKGEETDTEDEEDARVHVSALYAGGAVEDEGEDEDEEYDYDAEPVSTAKRQAGGGDDGDNEDGQDTQIVKEEGESGEHKRLLPLRGGNGAAQPMGDAEEENEYDEDAIFAHLVFYIDTAENAEKNGLAGSEPAKEVTESLKAAQEQLAQNGGRITSNLSDPRLTHVIMDDDDSDRYAEIMRRTAKPKMRHIVLPSWVEECVDEETLMNEDGHKPR